MYMDRCLHILALILPTALHNLSLNCTIFDSPSRIWVAYKNSKFAPRRIQLTFIEITACASLSLSLLLCLSLTVYLMPHFSRDSWQHCLKFCCKFQSFHATFPTCCLSISSICREECVCVCWLSIYFCIWQRNRILIRVVYGQKAKLQSKLQIQ